MISALARKNGLRGLSEVVQHAVDTYLGSLDAQATEAVLGLEGTLSERSAAAMDAAMQRTRLSWRLARVRSRH